MINLPGPDTTDWGTLYNNAINQLETMINSANGDISGLQTLLTQFQIALAGMQDSISVLDGLNTQDIDHNGTPLSDIVHNLEGSFNNSITPGTKTKITYDAKGFVTGGSNLIASDIPELPMSKIIGLSDFIHLVLVDMNAVSISASIRNTNGGIRVSCFTNPAVHVQSWRVIMEWKGSIYYDVYTSSSESFINMGNYPEIADGSTVNIIVEAISGKTSNSSAYFHKYVYVSTSIDLRITAVENNLAPQAIIDRLVQDENAITQIANILQHSNTLIRKLDEYINS